MRSADIHPRRSTLLRWTANVVRLSDVDTNPQLIPSKLYFEQQRQFFLRQIENALEGSNSSKGVVSTVRRATSSSLKCRPFELLMSHQGVRRLAGELLFQQIFPEWRRCPDRLWFFGTFLTDIGNTLEYAPHLELGRLKRDVSKMLRSVQMHSIGVVELQMARYPLGKTGRTIQAHVHTIGYVNDTAWNAKKLKYAIAERSTLSNWLGAPVAIFKPIPNRANLEHWCDYVLKAPVEESWLVTDKDKRSGFRTQSHGQVNRGGALRLAEMLAHLTLRSATLAYGDMVLPKGEWINAVKTRLSKYPIPPDLDYAEAFQGVWDCGSFRRERDSPIIRTDARLPIDLGWDRAMASRFLEVAANQASYDSDPSATLCRQYHDDL